MSEHEAPCNHQRGSLELLVIKVARGRIVLCLVIWPWCGIVAISGSSPAKKHIYSKTCFSYFMTVQCVKHPLPIRSRRSMLAL